MWPNSHTNPHSTSHLHVWLFSDFFHWKIGAKICSRKIFSPLHPAELYRRLTLRASSNQPWDKCSNSFSSLFLLPRKKIVYRCFLFWVEQYVRCSNLFYCSDSVDLAKRDARESSPFVSLFRIFMESIMRYMFITSIWNIWCFQKRAEEKFFAYLWLGWQMHDA